MQIIIKFNNDSHAPLLQERDALSEQRRGGPLHQN